MFKIKMNRYFLMICILIISVLSDTVKQTIQLDHVYSVALQKGQNKTFSVSVKNLKSDQSLFIEAGSPFYDQYQIPQIIVKSQNNYKLLCSENSNQYVGICQIQYQNLKQNKVFDIQIKCYDKCNLKLQAFLSDTFQLYFGQKVIINALKQMGEVTQLQIQVPADLNFTDIAVIAKITNQYQATKGVGLYVNVGNFTTKIPSTQSFSFTGKSLWGSGSGVFLNKDQVKPGDWIKVYLVVGQGVKVQFYTMSIKGNHYDILLNTPYQDFTSDKQTKYYTLDLTKYLSNKTDQQLFKNQTIQIVFAIYSGSPSIQVSFDQKFQKFVDNYDLQGTVGYLLTPQLRQTLGFNNKIYIKVNSAWSSDYYLFAYIMSNNYFDLNNGVSFVNRVSKGHIHNYIYDSLVVIDGNRSTIQNYRVKIQLISGNAQLGIRKCNSLQQNDTMECLIYDSSQLLKQQVKQSFDQIDVSVRRDWTAYQLIFDYDAKKCKFYRSFGNLTVYNCDFQIIVFPNQKNTQQLIYSITFYENREVATLKEGVGFKDFIYKDTYHYYDFELPNLNNVEQVSVHLTIISGDSGIMGTTNQKYKYMQFTDAFQQDDIIFSFFNTLTFHKQILAKQFYIGVYAYQASQITVSVIVKRKNNQTNNQTVQRTTLNIIQGLSHQHTLLKGQDQVNFAFISKNSSKISIQIIEIQGTVQYNLIKDNDNSSIKCINKGQVGQKKCTFDSLANTKYRIEVNSTKGEIQRFSISYFYDNKCKKYPFNLPQFIYLGAKQNQCSVYSVIDMSKSIQILTSFSTYDYLTTSVQFQLVFNDQHKINMTDRTKIITSDQLKQFCKSDQIDNCNMQINIIGDQIQNVQFYFVVQQIGKQMSLFDGIVRKVVDSRMTQKKGKFFYYQVPSKSQNIKIFLTDKDNDGYYLAAKFVDQMDFTANPDNLYLSYKNISQNSFIQNGNEFQARIGNKKGTSFIQIQSQKFKKLCEQCVLLISVFGTELQSNQANVFQIQVTQIQSFIYLGQQKTGFIGQDQIYVYEINGNPLAESVLTLRDFMKQSSTEQNCFQVNLLQQKTLKVTQIKSGFIILNASSSSYKVVIQNIKQGICTYQISYSSLTTPVNVLSEYMANQIRLTKSQSKYFLYKHRNKQDFQVLSYIKTGDLKIYVNKIDNTNTIDKLINKNLDLYDFKSNVGDSFLYVHNKDTKKFCQNCYYLIAFKGDPTVQAQITIVKGQQPLALTTYGILKQSLQKTQKQLYVFHSIYDFNVSVIVLYGKIRVVIKSPDTNFILNRTLTLSTQLLVPRPKTAQGQLVDYFNDNSKFTVQVQALQQCVYYISVKRKNITMRIYQGVPVVLQLKPQNTTLQFVNIDSSNNVTVLVQVKQQILQDFILKATAQVKRDGNTVSQKIQEPIIQRSQNSFNFMFKSIKGTYFITLTPKQKISSQILLAKKKLTHLMASNTNLFVSKGTFQIYTPGQNIMIVIDSCQKQVQVRATQDYQTIIDDSDKNKGVLLQHANYGGHYVVTAENVDGQYYVSVLPKNAKDDMLYLISYYYYNKDDLMPYKQVDITPQISYQVTPDKIIFILSPVRLVSSKSNMRILPIYTLYLSNSSQISDLNSRCSLSYGFSMSSISTQNNTQPIKFAIDYKTISKQVGQSTDIYFVSAKVRVKFSGTNLPTNYPSFVDLAYTKTQITQAHHTIQFKSQTPSKIKYVLMWIVVPLILAGVLFFFAFKFCIKKYRQLYPDQLVQQDRQYGNSEGQMKQMGNAVSQSLSNT